MSLTPRSHKRKVPPVLPQDPDEEELQPVPSLPASPAPAPAELVVEDASKEKQDDDGFSPEEEERLRIWDMFAEEYHDIVAELPLEYQRTFLLLSELEETQQSSTAALKSSLQSHIVALSNPTAPASPIASTSAPSYVEEDEGPSPFQRQTLSSIAKSARAAVRAGEDKVGLAVALYESVDRHIRRLDADLAKYEDSLVIGLRDGTLPSHDAPSLSLKSPPGPTTSRGAIALGERDAFGELEEPWKRRRGGGRGGMEEQEARRIKQEKRRHRKEQEERETRERPIVVDPNEPTYCYCDRVSFGEMIGCDNDDCPREWFHLECVGMQIPPVGKWYCEDCAKNFGVAPKKSRKNR